MNTYLLLAIASIYLILALYYYNRLNVLMLWLSYLPTLLHEFGHAIVCQLTGGKVRDIVIVTRKSERLRTGRNGYVVSQTTSGWNRFATYIAGYLFPPLFLIIGVYCLLKMWQTGFWIMFGLVFLYYFAKTSRKIFPFFVMLLIVGGCYLYYQYPDVVSLWVIGNWAIYIVLGILLADTLLSSYTITLIYLQRNTTWDGAMLSQLTRLPVLIYYLLFVTIQLGSCWFVVKMLV
ncbi:M50 family metallopeptidase [Macrococcoides caseolyticum]|uniref:M50 family metallopeptidase n=1 Tax=Macrococcoides caseolyticum TaxID=69966 RepID=UPI001F25F22A|nr:M50 family metallopeptidase [Macrococcus caseolyticus]MCE4956475.1 M50 family metallopeptidase [Macrococcus caseolyticus]